MRLWGELQAGGVDGSSPPIPKSTIKYSNGILLRGKGRERLPDASGQTLGVAGSSGRGRDFLRSRTEPVSRGQDFWLTRGPVTRHVFDVTHQDDSSFLSCFREAEFSYACGCWEVVGVGVGACLGRGGVCAPLGSLGYITALIRLYFGAAAAA